MLLIFVSGFLATFWGMIIYLLSKNPMLSLLSGIGIYAFSLCTLALVGGVKDE